MRKSFHKVPTRQPDAGEALRRANERVAGILGSITDLYISYDHEWRFTELNPQAEYVLGRKREEVIGKVLWEVFPQSKEGEIYKRYQGAMANQIPVHFETFFTIVGRWFEVHAYPSEEGLSTYLRDITERKQMEQKIAELASFAHLNPNPVVEVDLAGTIHYLNQAAQELIPDLQPMGSQHPWFQNWDSVVAIFSGEGKVSHVRDIRIGNFWYEQAICYVPKLERIHIYGLDITERKRAEQALADQKIQLERMNRELVALNAELDDFTHMSSHDLQEPLRTLTAFSDLLRKDLGQSLPERAARDLGFITDASKRMQTLIQDLLALSRVGRVAKKREKVSLSECADQALEALAMRVKETGAQLVRDELPEVWGDSILLTQLYQNLIGNALKFSGDRRPMIQLTLEERDGDQIFGVKDNGIGIEPKYAQEIFKPFRRLHGRAEYEGSGIGLAICRKIVDRHGGKIWVESESGIGAHFRFTILHRKKKR